MHYITDSPDEYILYIHIGISSLHHDVPLLLLLRQRFLLLVAFIYAFDHYDEENYCKNTENITTVTTDLLPRVWAASPWCRLSPTAESQRAGQDAHRGPDPQCGAPFVWGHVAVTQLCAVTHSHWQVEEREQHACELNVRRVCLFWERGEVQFWVCVWIFFSALNFSLCIDAVKYVTDFSVAANCRLVIWI